MTKECRKKRLSFSPPRGPQTPYQPTQELTLSIHIYIFFIHIYFIFPYSLLQNIEYSSLCYTVGHCWLSIVYIVMCRLIPDS